SRVATPTRADGVPRTRPLAVARPTRSPVNDPGPTATETAFRSATSMPARSRHSSISGTSASPCWRRASRVISARSSGRATWGSSAATTPTLPVRVDVSIPRTSERLVSASAREQAVQVVVEREAHERDQEEHPDLLGDLALADLERAAEHLLDSHEEEVAAVEDRNRKQVQHAEVDAEKRHEAEERRQALVRLLARELHDEERPAEVRGRHDRLEELHDREDREPRDLDRLGDPLPDGPDRVAALDHEVVGGPDADRVDRHRLAEDRLVLGVVRRDREL